MVDSEMKKKITAKLDERIKDLTCPMCQNHDFVITDGYFITSLQNDLDSIRIGGGSSLATIPIVCGNCGFVSQHSLKVLGLLPGN